MNRRHWQRLLQCLYPAWMKDRTPDSNHFFRRCFTRRHQVRKAMVRPVWMCAGMLILLYPTLPFALLVSLPATFISFIILDEIP